MTFIIAFLVFVIVLGGLLILYNLRVLAGAEGARPQPAPAANDAQSQPMAHGPGEAAPAEAAPAGGAEGAAADSEAAPNAQPVAGGFLAPPAKTPSGVRSPSAVAAAEGEHGEAAAADEPHRTEGGSAET